MYTVIKRFQERFDDGHDYGVGDAYPREGFTPPEGRAESLCNGGVSSMNANGAVFLQAVVEKPRTRKRTTESR